MSKNVFRRAYRLTLKLGLLTCSALACADAPAPILGTNNITHEAFTQPLSIMPDSAREAFFRGRSLFRQNWVIAPAGDDQVDGLGPLHNRISCISCHAANGKGHAPNGPHEKAGFLLVRLSVPGANPNGGPLPHPVYGDQLNEDAIPGVPAEGRVQIHWREHKVTLTGGEVVRLRSPRIAFRDLAYGPMGKVQTSARIGPAVFGLGLLDAVPVEALEKLAAENQAYGVRGKLNLVHDAASAQTMPGRFGLKANRSVLRDQIAGAMIGDLGITSTLFTEENCMPAQKQCRQAPNGNSPDGHSELNDEQLDELERYLAFLAPPLPRNMNAPEVEQGRRLFNDMGCAACHRPQLPLGRHKLLGDLRGQNIAPYTDLLVHDMGADLADHRSDFRAGGREWRTAPLWGAGLLKKMNARVGYLHDGRARTVQEAILWHGGSASPARNNYSQAPRDQRNAVLSFIGSL
ncbi:MAG: thiol oxidoreductase [Rhodocyclaceae bacterium]|nr:thiol oxidoreductase [Rhodocyclaceae bacterium]